MAATAVEYGEHVGRKDSGEVDGVSEHVPEQELAVAVIQHALSDLRSTKPGRKQKAQQDIARGLLDYWVMVATTDLDAQDAIKGGLRKIIQRDVFGSS